jgi:hypothetical protein
MNSGGSGAWRSRRSREAMPKVRVHCSGHVAALAQGRTACGGRPQRVDKGVKVRARDDWLLTGVRGGGEFGL